MNQTPFRRRQHFLSFAIATALATIPGTAPAAMVQELTPVPLASLVDHNISQLGATALGIHPADWKHAETANFVYHFINNFIAAPVSVEAEFYYRVYAKDLNRDTTQWERKSHIYIFETSQDWAEFQRKASLDPWTGGIHSNNDLFIIRNREYKFKGHSLGHEISHLVFHRFFGNGIPLWLNEGYAEYSSKRAYTSFMRARNYMVRQSSPLIPEQDLIPLNVLADLSTYPSDEHKVEVFYTESEKLVRFLGTEDKLKLVELVDLLSKGNRFESALWKSYGSRFASLDALQTEFKTYAAKNLEN